MLAVILYSFNRKVNRSIMQPTSNCSNFLLKLHSSPAPGSKFIGSSVSDTNAPPSKCFNIRSLIDKLRSVATNDHAFLSIFLSLFLSFFLTFFSNFFFNLFPKERNWRINALLNKIGCSGGIDIEMNCTNELPGR